MEERLKNRHIEEKEETFRSVLFSNLFSIIKILVICSVAVYFSYNYFVHPIRVHGDSMYPTLKNSEFGVSNAFAGRFLEVKRLDIVVIYDVKLDLLVIKRVIGLPGDSIYAKNDAIYVNNKKLDEPYLNNDYAEEVRSFDGQFTQDFEEVTMGDDEYFVLGDNRVNSQDSRTHGAYKKQQIRGSGISVLLPIEKFRIIQ